MYTFGKLTTFFKMVCKTYPANVNYWLKLQNPLHFMKACSKVCTEPETVSCNLFFHVRGSSQKKEVSMDIIAAKIVFFAWSMLIIAQIVLGVNG